MRVEARDLQLKVAYPSLAEQKGAGDLLAAFGLFILSMWRDDFERRGVGRGDGKHFRNGEGPCGKCGSQRGGDGAGGEHGDRIRRNRDAAGYYTLPVLPVGHYELDVGAMGFRDYERRGSALDTNAALTIDCSLEDGRRSSETVSVTDNALHVETVSTQMGEVISGRQMTSVPLNGRSFTDLLSLQPGVAPDDFDQVRRTVQDVGATILESIGNAQSRAQFR